MNEVRPLVTYHSAHKDVLLNREENIFVKEICSRQWEKIH
jgi:hypothetical protein